MTKTLIGPRLRQLRRERKQIMREEELAIYNLEAELSVRSAALEKEGLGTRLKNFFRNAVRLDNKQRRDLYVPTVLLQFVIFITVLAGFSAFQSRASALERLSENSIPVSLLAGLLTVFVVIVLDRAFYLKRAMAAKLALHYVTLIVTHIYFFLLLPVQNNRSFPSNGVLIFIYVLFLGYFTLSAEQLRAGYPVFVLGNVLTRSAGIPGYIVYVVYRLVPFLHEVRVRKGRE